MNSKERGIEAADGWIQSMEDAWGGVPGSDLLRNADHIWLEIALPPPSRSEAATWALAGRMLKSGISLDLGIPLFDRFAMARLLVYLHRLHFDALEGAIRSAWLNPTAASARPDVVVLSYAPSRFHEFARITRIHPRALAKAKRDEECREAAYGQTWFAKATDDPMVLAENIDAVARPFVFVIDNSVANESVGPLLTALNDAFPGVPRLLLSPLGDRTALDALDRSHVKGQRWQLRLGDIALLDPIRGKPASTTLLEIPDSQLNGLLLQAFDQFFALRRQLKQNRDPVLTEKLAIFGKVLRAINSLAAPMDMMEGMLERRTRPGRFPVRSLARWLETADRGSCRYGETQISADQLASQLRVTLRALLQAGAVPGKAAALLEWAQGVIGSGSTGVVLAGSASECEVLQLWFDDRLDMAWRGCITVVAMDSSRALAASLPVDHCALIGALWPSRMPWLGLACTALTVFLYPHEVMPTQRIIEMWRRDFAAASQHSADKMKLWSLSFGDDECLFDRDVASLSEECAHRVSKCTGTYPRPAYKAEVPLEIDTNDWIEDLLKEPAEPAAGEPDQVAVAGETARIRTVNKPQGLIWSSRRPVLVLKGEKIESLVPEDLVAGDEIILLEQSEDRVATTENLIELVVEESDDLRHIIALANRWGDWCDEVGKRFPTAAAINKRLVLQGISITNQSISLWLRGGVIGPRENKVVFEFAKMAGVVNRGTATAVINAIERIRSVHQTIGRTLRQAIVARANGAESVKIGSILMDGHLFDQLIQIDEVVGVDLSATQRKEIDAPATLQACAESIRREHPGRLHFSLPAMKSMRDSPYEEMDKFQRCLELMATSLYDCYREKSLRMSDVLAEFEQEGITFQSNLSAVTEGMFGSEQRYNGRKADLNRYFRLGKARDVTKTLRIHFEWDSENELIAIHHAGRHRKNTQT